MAEIKYVSLENLTRYDGNLKTYIDSDKTKALKALTVKDNSISFYTNPDPNEATIADFTVDLPTEIFLDQTKTTFVQSFIWDDVQYPGSTNPNLEGKPVLVLAVKGDDEVTYSFLNMETLVDVYEGGDTNSIKVSVSADNKITANLQISTEAGNILSIKDDGLYASVTSVDISGKADKLTGDAIKADQILVDDGTGNLKNSDVLVSDVVTKLEGATAQNLLVVGADGGMVDSGVKLSDVNNTFTAITDDEIDALFA